MVDRIFSSLAGTPASLHRILRGIARVGGVALGVVFAAGQALAAGTTTCPTGFIRVSNGTSTTTPTAYVEQTFDIANFNCPSSMASVIQNSTCATTFETDGQHTFKQADNRQGSATNRAAVAYNIKRTLDGLSGALADNYKVLSTPAIIFGQTFDSTSNSYIANVPEGTPLKFSSWKKERAGSPAYADFSYKAIDAATNTVLAKWNPPSFTAASNWINDFSPTFYMPASKSVRIEIYTDINGASNGNDPDLDDIGLCRATASVQIKKTTTNGSGGPFTWTGTNLVTGTDYPTLTPLTTTVAGTAVTMPAVVVTANSNVVLTETPVPIGFALKSATCTDLAGATSGNGSWSLTTGFNAPVSIPAVNIKQYSVISCSFTNDKFTPPALTKTSLVYSDPVNGAAAAAKMIPGAMVDYDLNLKNVTGVPLASGSVVFEDKVPAGLSLFVNNRGGTPAGPVSLIQGSPTSGLSLTYTSLSSTTDSVQFSSDNGATWAYVPTPDAAGVDPLVTNIRVTTSGTMAAATEVTLRLRMQIK